LIIRVGPKILGFERVCTRGKYFRESLAYLHKIDPLSQIVGTFYFERNLEPLKM
jgi:hypothetical protein